MKAEVMRQSLWRVTGHYVTNRNVRAGSWRRDVITLGEAAALEVAQRDEARSMVGARMKPIATKALAIRLI